MLSQLSLDGKNIVITGAGTGLGKEMALAIAKAGGNLVLAARRMDRISEVAEHARDSGVKVVLLSALKLNVDETMSRAVIFANISKSATSETGSIPIKYSSKSL